MKRWLTEDQARAILKEAAACPGCGEVPSMKALAARHKTSPSTVSRLIAGQHRFSNVTELGVAQ